MSELAQQLRESWENHILNKRRVSRAQSNRASELGHECEKYLVLTRTCGEDRKKPDLMLQSIFNEGNMQGEVIKRTLSEMGFPVLRAESSFTWDAYQISGHIDGAIEDRGEQLPIEIKALSPYTFQQAESVDSMLNSRYSFLKKYPAQLTLYMLMTNRERGVFVLKNKATGEIRFIEMALSYEYGEQLLQKAERINKHIADGTLPAGIDNDECERCDFYHICLPDIIREDHDIIHDAEMQEMLEERRKLEIIKKQYDQIERSLKKKFKPFEGRPFACGDFFVEWKEILRKGYTVESSKYWNKKIIYMEK